MVKCYDIDSWIYFQLKNQYFLLILVLFPIVVAHQILPKTHQFQKHNVDISDAIT